MRGEEPGTFLPPLESTLSVGRAVRNSGSEQRLGIAVRNSDSEQRFEDLGRKVGSDPAIDCNMVFRTPSSTHQRPLGCRKSPDEIQIGKQRFRIDCV